MKTGTLKHKTLKSVVKWYGQPDELHYADPGTGVTWNGKEGNPEHYGGRRILWCELETGESVGLEMNEVEWNEKEK